MKGTYMENKPKTIEEFEQAIGVLAEGLVDLQAVVTAQGELLRVQDAAIKALARLQTSDHITLEYLSHQKAKA
jgi:hypothetical protein